MVMHLAEQAAVVEPSEPGPYTRCPLYKYRTRAFKRQTAVNGTKNSGLTSKECNNG